MAAVPFDIAASLSAERDALQLFVSLLENEQRILLGKDTEQLLDLAEQKTTFTTTLIRMAESRQTFVRSLDIALMDSWLSAHRPETLPIWQKLTQLAERAQQLNKINGEMIQVRLRHNQQALAVLNRATLNAEVYGPDGQSNAGGSRRTFGAA